MSKRSKKTISAVLILVLILILVFSRVIFRVYPKIQNYLKIKSLEKQNEQTMEEVKTAEAQAETRTKAPNALLPETKFLEVPFICQAPLETTKNWEIHETSCEEAALLQAYLFETNSTMTKEEADKEIQKMTDWQNQNMGGEHDLYADELKQFIMGYYGLTNDQVKVIHNASIDDIKAEINIGHPVIAPVTAKLIDNPYYPYPGYHMLTVIGYTADKIITNDNGTRHGASFSYDTQTFLTAMNDAGGDVVVLFL